MRASYRSPGSVLKEDAAASLSSANLGPGGEHAIMCMLMRDAYFGLRLSRYT